ncbi:UUP1 family membrane protein [Desulfobotulus mexicanus]|uniref:Gonadoliberin III n=1 Tax=Desulfobotulus mexicanus TaxID=2586642 RepID=A0A5S5MFH7_9BACT|nr:UUP1 family membrane protein [Desulfobotulus mexicanus]TYT74454.1 gonadoliberin III [Desulfobotulus mexicanus]
MQRVSLYWIVGLLIISGISLAWLRHTQMQIPFKPGSDTGVWLIEARVTFTASQRPVLASLSIPKKPPGFRLFNEQAASPGYGFSIVDQGENRRAEWSRRTAEGTQTLYYKIQLTRNPEKQQIPEHPPASPDSVNWRPPEATAAHALIEAAGATSSTPESLTREIIKILNASEKEQNAALLLADYRQEILLTRLLAEAGIPSRVVQGIFLEDGRRNQSLVPMVEVFARDQWILFNPATGEQGVPEHFLLWHRSGPSLLDLSGGSSARVSFSMIYQSIPALEMARVQSSNNGFSFLSMHHLPLDQQGVFKLLLLIPMGALVVTFMRILIGVSTSGTFMPVLIGMAFLQTSLIPGLIYFLTIVGTGLLLRSYLSYLNLLLVARIATIVIIVITLITLASLMSIRLGFHTGMPVTAFPLIIIAWTIERMSILWEEEGMREVMVQGTGSLVVALCAYAFMRHPTVAHLSFNFPELNLVIAALILLMGQYTGYRLFELHRFAAMKDRTP